MNAHSLPLAPHSSEKRRPQKHVPREARDSADARALRADGQEDPVGSEIRRAAYEQRWVQDADRLKEDMILWRHIRRGELFMQRRLRIVKELDVHHQQSR